MGIGFEERLRSLNTPGMVAKGVPRPALKKMIAAPPRPVRGRGQNCGVFAGQNENP